jgi:geranylgeranyl diphosphate synthase type I
VTSSSADVPVGRRGLDTGRSVTDPALRAAVERLDVPNRRVAGYHLGFLDGRGAPVDGPRGKGVRGALALLSARAAGGSDTEGIPAAVACELVHEASLLHDDIVDRDTLRRGAPTAWTVFGPAPAIIAGDALLALAVEVLAEAGAPGTVGPAVGALARANRRVMAGQAADVAFEARASVGLEEARAMVADKTGALLSCAASLGAVLAGAPDRLSAGLAAYGAHLGMAFQLVDDLLGIWGSPERTGKPVWSDLRARKKSLPVVAALTSGSGAGQRLSVIYTSGQELEGVLLAEAARCVEDAGGRDWAAAEAARETDAALAIVAGLEIPGPVRDELIALAGLLGDRDR